VIVQLAVVVVHGIGSSSPGFADAMITEVSDRLVAAGHDPATVAWQPILWADLLASRQAAYLERAAGQGELDHLWLRRFVVGALGDAAAYQYVDSPSSTYVQVHDRIRQRMRDLSVDRLGERPVPLVVLAHSLGSHIASSYVWDTQRGKPTGAGPTASAFERFGHLAGFVTFGSPLPLFTFAHDPVVPIDFPGRALAPAVAERAAWLNLYDRDDVLGYPLRPTSPGYAEVVDADIELDAGPWGLSATPASHTAYWTDRDVTRAVAELLGGLLVATRRP
jgi:hypothetical protein